MSTARRSKRTVCTALAAYARDAMLSTKSGGGGIHVEEPLHRCLQRSPPSARRQACGRACPHLKELQAAGVTSLRGIAAALNDRGIPTATGYGRWHHVQVGKVLARLER
jgi:hypothetical protein